MAGTYAERSAGSRPVTLPLSAPRDGRYGASTTEAVRTLLERHKPLSFIAREAANRRGVECRHWAAPARRRGRPASLSRGRASSRTRIDARARVRKEARTLAVRL